MRCPLLHVCVEGKECKFPRVVERHNQCDYILVWFSVRFHFDKHQYPRDIDEHVEALSINDKTEDLLNYESLEHALDVKMSMKR